MSCWRDNILLLILTFFLITILSEIDNSRTTICSQVMPKAQGRHYWSKCFVLRVIQSSYASGKFQFFQGHGIVREFFTICQGKMKFCQNVREFYISVVWNLRCLVLMYLSCIIHKIFVSGIVREIWCYVREVGEMSGNFVLSYVWEPCNIIHCYVPNKSLL